MWTREQIKANAKYVLQRTYWMSFLVSFIFGIIAGFGSGGSSGGSAATSSANMHEQGYISAEVVILISVIVLVLSCVGLLIKAFLVNPVEVGYNRYYIAARQGKGDIAQLFSGFSQGYMNIVKILFLRDLYIFLWTLLFIIPGIVKAYSYQMLPYLLAENPYMDSARAFEITRKMTDGQKSAMFVLDLSFLGWYLLGILACCIGTMFVTPYAKATYTELYEVLRYNALANGWCAPDELGGPGGYTGEKSPVPAPPPQYL